MKRWLPFLSLAFLVITASTPAHARAQTSSLDFDRPESWGMKYSVSIATFGGFGVPSPLESGAFEVAGELANIPQLSDSERRIGFDGTKLEDMNKSSVFGRVRARVGVGGGWSAEMGVVPPVTVGGATPLMVAAALAGPLWESARVRTGVRLHGQVGRVEGDITCDATTVAAGLNNSANPFNCEAESDDEVVHKYGGVELSASLPRGSWEPYVVVGGNYIDSEFRVDAQYSSTTSTEVLMTNGATVSGALGVTVSLGGGAHLSVEGSLTPLSVVRPPQTTAGRETLFNVRALLRYRIR